MTSEKTCARRARTTEEESNPRHIRYENRSIVSAGVKQLAVGRKNQRFDLAAMPR
jgi:hypothetical protein